MIEQCSDIYIYQYLNTSCSNKYSNWIQEGNSVRGVHLSAILNKLATQELTTT